MRVFPTEIVIRNSEVRYRFTADYLIHGIIIPKGFETDGASVPKIFWWAFPPVEIYFGSAVVHDFQLESGVDWKSAERDFKINLKSDGVSDSRIFLMVNAVRLYGFLRGKRNIF